MSTIYDAVYCALADGATHYGTAMGRRPIQGFGLGWVQSARTRWIYRPGIGADGRIGAIRADDPDSLYVSVFPIYRV